MRLENLIRCLVELALQVVANARSQSTALIQGAPIVKIVRAGKDTAYEVVPASAIVKIVASEIIQLPALNVVTVPKDTFKLTLKPPVTRA